MIAYSTGSLYGTKYYKAEHIFNESIIEHHHLKWSLMKSWLSENCDWSMLNLGFYPKDKRLYVYQTTFWFRDVEDLMMFKLRWGE